MNFEIKKMEIPSIPEFNFEELKAELQEKTTKYENVLYNDNEISQAKKDRADLNKLKKAINDGRIQKEKEYMAPFNEFKAKVNEILALFDKPIDNIDKQIKEYEKAAAEQKRKMIDEMFAAKNPFPWLNIEQIFNAKWMNASMSKKAIEEEMKMSFDMITTEMKSIESLDYKEEALKVYMKTLSMTTAMERVANLKELDKIKEEQAKKEEQTRQEEPAAPVENIMPEPEQKEDPKAQEEPKEWMQMEICLNAADFEKFDAWTKANGIEWRLR